MRSEFRLDKIELYNVFNYRGTHVIDFTPRRKGNMYLFDVFNGGGKTSLFLSIKWGFYGFDNDIKYVKDGKNLKSKDFMNKFERDNDTFHVKIYFTFNGKHMELRRECLNIKDDLSKVTLKTPEALLAGDDAKEIIDSIIPQDCGDFFMFNGEILEVIANKQKDVLRSDGVIRMLGLKKIDTLKHELGLIKRTLSSELTQCNKESGAARNDSEMLEQTNAKIEELRAQMRALHLDIDSSKKKRSELGEERYKYSNLESTIQSLQNESNKFDDVSRKIQNLRRNIQVDAPKAFLIFLKDDIKKVIEDNEKKIPEIKRDEIVVDNLETESVLIRKKALMRHLSECPVCKSILTDDIIAMFEETLANRKKSAEDLERITAEKRRINKVNDILKQNLKKIPDDIQKECTDLYNLTEELHKIETNINHLKEISKNSDIDAVKNLTKQISELDQSIYVKERNYDELDHECTKYTNYAKKLEHQITTCADMSSRSKVISKQLNLVSKLVGKLDEVIVTITDSKRSDILKEANDIFMDVTNKPHAYSGLAYNSSTDFSMHIVGKEGDVIENPSSGENHVIAFCFLLSLSKNTEHINPLVMDTPLSRLDMDHKRNMSRALGKLDNQILFLAQSGEIDPETLKYYEPLATKKFIAVPNQNNEAHIEEVEL